VIVHWDDVEGRCADLGHLSARWTDLGTAAGTRGVGLKRIEIDPGRWSTPAHWQGAEEEIFFVLGGSGLSWQEGRTYELRPRDCIVHPAGREAHTLRAGDDGLDVLAFGTRVPVEIGFLPRAGVGWLGETWVEAGAKPYPWEREVAAGEPDAPEPAPRPATIVNVDECEGSAWDEGDTGGVTHALGAAAGSVRTGLNLDTIPAGKLNSHPHCHAAEEEIFVVLGGEGHCLLGDDELPVRRGHVVGRPPGTGVAHTFRAGAPGLELLCYGTREPNDIVYYPRERKAYFRGLRLLTRLEPVE
jgi:uncharacterized cupin superfamily protein